MKTHAHYIAPLCARGEPFDPRPTCTYDEDEAIATEKVVEAQSQSTGMRAFTSYAWQR